MIGLRGIRVDEPSRVGSAWDDALASDRPVVYEAITDPQVPPLPPHITLEQARALMSALRKGDPNAGRGDPPILHAEARGIPPGAMSSPRLSARQSRFSGPRVRTETAAARAGRRGSRPGAPRRPGASEKRGFPNSSRRLAISAAVHSGLSPHLAGRRRRATTDVVFSTTCFEGILGVFVSSLEIDRSVPPSGTGCQECLAGAGPGWWLHLRRCATCGHAGCCDTSPAQHASAHFTETGHPVLRALSPERAGSPISAARRSSRARRCSRRTAIRWSRPCPDPRATFHRTGRASCTEGEEASSPPHKVTRSREGGSAG